MKLYSHQIEALKATSEKTHVAYYLDMGLGKTFVGSEKMISLAEKKNLIVCQKSKIQDWIDHFKINYRNIGVHDLTKEDIEIFVLSIPALPCIGIINYDLTFRRKELRQLKDFTLLLDESSLIQNISAKRSKFILQMQPKNVILLSGTPTNGKYENLISQINLLGWKISENTFWNQYVDWKWDETQDGFWRKKINGYKNVERLKTKLRNHGCYFLKTEEVLDLPEQIEIHISVNPTKDYQKFKKDKVLLTDYGEFIGNTILTQILRERQLCGIYNADKLEALKDLIESTENRIIIFYNFDEELGMMADMVDEMRRPISIINGNLKGLKHYEECENSVTIIQYQAGAYGLNLQKANTIIYFTPPLSSELFEQSKKRIHRIGQESSCFYYYLTVKNSIEEKIYRSLKQKKDYTEELFREENE